MSTPPPSERPEPSDGAGSAAAGPLAGHGWRRQPTGWTGPTRASAPWPGWAEARTDLRSALTLVLGAALAGVPVGVVWEWLAPRAEFRITGNGPVPVGSPSPELLVADDVVFTLVLAGSGLVLGAVAWLPRRCRGVATVVALAVGACLTGVVAWQLGELLGAGPTEAQLADVGGIVTTSLSLGSAPALAVAPFTALAAYIAAVLHAPEDDLGRPGDLAAAGSADEAGPVPLGPADQRPLVDLPPPGRPSG